MALEVWIPSAATVIVTVATLTLGPSWKARVERRAADRARAEEKADQASQQVERLQARVEQMGTDLNAAHVKIARLEAELVAFQMGAKVATGWVAIPEYLVTVIRERDPSLLPGRYPGEDD